MAAAYASLSQSIENAKLRDDLGFEAQQLTRNSSEQGIASRLRTTGLGMDSPEAQFMRDFEKTRA